MLQISLHVLRNRIQLFNSSRLVTLPNQCYCTDFSEIDIDVNFNQFDEEQVEPKAP